MFRKGRKMMARMMAGAVNRVNFINLITRISESRLGRPHLERYQSLPQDWADAEEISELATDLTMDQLLRENQTVERQEIADLIEEIRIRYDRDLHLRTAAAFRVVFGHLFDHVNPDLPFTSPDGRELAHLDELRKYREQGLGVMYLINHNSHLDEFIFDSLLQDLGLGLPVFAAGQNMMAIRSIADILMIGSYVVLRKGASRHQMAALYNYCSALSRAGAQQGIFLEAWRGGARTRDGSLRYPKRLVAVRGAIDTGDRDLVVQPVALSYSVVPEDLMMCARKSGKTWFNGISPLKTLLNLPLHPRSFLWRSAENLYGRSFVSLPKPMLLSELRQEWEKDIRGTDFDEFVALHAITQIARKKKIMSANLVARGMRGAARTGEKDLEKAMADEAKTIKVYHRQTFGHAPDFEDFIEKNPPEEVIRDGFDTLRKRGILSRWTKDGLGLPTVLNTIGLSYYATHGDRRLYSPTADQNIVVAGAGNWGFALADMVAQRLLEGKKYDNASITIYDSRKKRVRHMGRERLGPGRFSDRRLRKNVFVTYDLASAFRKASEVIIAVRPENFEEIMRQIIPISEQHMKIIIATRGFIPNTTLLPFHQVQNLLVEFHRTDMDVLTLAGPIETDDLVENAAVSGIIAGRAGILEEMADLFLKPQENRLLSTDPIGVQAADILARVYALGVNILSAAREEKKGFLMGRLFAQASTEARNLTLAMGASPATFHAGSIPWTGTFAALALDGPLQELGEKLGTAVKKGKDPARTLNKLSAHWRQDTTKIQVVSDMESALACGEQRGVDLPLLREVYDLIFKPGDV